MIHSSKKKKIILLVTNYLLLVTAFIGCAKREIKNIDSKGKNIVCLGNSLTAGKGASPDKDFPTLLSKALDLEVINTGIDGDTTIEALKRIEFSVLNKEPLLVIVELGGNDFLLGIPKEETFKNLEEIIRQIQDRGSMVALADISSGLFMADYAKEYRRLAKKYNAILIPGLLKGVITNPQFKSDPIHPNDAGYEIIASRILKVIKPVLEKNLKSRK